MECNLKTNMIIPDNETSVDFLYYEAIAATVVSVVNQSDDNPLTVGVHGDWGAGKSSVLAMIKEAYDQNDDTVCMFFNGWAFEGLEDTKAVLIETIIETLIEQKKLSGKIKDKAQKLLERVNWLKVARKAGGLAFTVATGVPTIDQAKDVIGGLKALVGGEDGIDKADIEGLLDGSGGYLNSPITESIPSHMHAFREEFIELLADAKVKRLVVVVDDLDRCLPETAIATLEAIRLFLFVPGAAFVIAADEAMIEYAVSKHFPDLPLSNGPASYARSYLEKLIQVPFRLPSLGYVETRTYLTLLNLSLSLESDDPMFVKLVELTREVLKRPWGGNGFSRETIAEKLGCTVPPKVESALALADQISPLLSEGTLGNPRQIKRFINAMNLRLAIAEQRGISDDIVPMTLAKMMLAERFSPDFFSHLEGEAQSDGISSTVKRLEGVIDAKSVTAQKGDVKNSKKKKDIPRPQLSQSGKDWNDSAWVKSWLSIQPKLAEVDLRPYFFVSRDRKGVFNSGGALAVKEALVDQLCGSELGARAAAQEVAKMTPHEAEQIFDQLARRIESASDLSKKPDGIDGLIHLCRLQPQLQMPTMSLMERLPIGKTGAWAASGWSGTISEGAAKVQLEKLFDGWAAQDGNKPLQTAAILTKKRKS